MSSDNLEIRHYTKELLLKILDLNRREYWDSDEGFQNVSFEDKFRLGRWWVEKNTFIWHRAILNNCEGEVLVAIKNGKLVGELDYVFSIEYGNNRKFTRIHIIWLLVDKKQRHQGIAKSLIRYLTDLYPEYQIWVEAEDEKSTQLYRSMGNIIHSLQNWEYTTNSNPTSNKNIENELEIKDLTYQQLYHSVERDDYHLFFGNYYALCFDLAQMKYSEPVHRLIWGNLAKPQIYQIKGQNTSVIVVLTQYIRLFIKHGKYEFHEFQKIMKWIIYELLDTGFQEIFIQNYLENDCDKILKSLGFNLITTEDIVFLI